MASKADTPLRDDLSGRDLAILTSLRLHRLATSTQLRRLHFSGVYRSEPSRVRSAQLVFSRLEQTGLIGRLRHRVGGVRRGSDSVVWQLTAAGDRIVTAEAAEAPRRYMEPSLAFAAHTIAVTEIAVQLVEANQAGLIELLTLTAEPDTWQRFTGLHGQVETLKPDLTAVVAVGDIEWHYAIEVDRGTEHVGVIRRKVQIYQRASAAGHYEAEHGVTPLVLWIVTDIRRQKALRDLFAGLPTLRKGVHRALLIDEFIPAITDNNLDPAEREETTT